MAGEIVGDVAPAVVHHHQVLHRRERRQQRGEQPEEGPVEDKAAEGFTTSEREAIADQPTEFFDQAPEPLELGELDLDLKDELDEPEGEEELLAGDEEAEEAEPGEEEEAEEAEDVLEETPEFLRDNPDDDELWFEQGEPKDFDF